MPWNNLAECRNADITACRADELADLKNIVIDRNKSVLQRTENFVEQVNNPYLFKVGDTVVKVAFGNGKDLSDILTDIMVAG